MHQLYQLGGDEVLLFPKDGTAFAVGYKLDKHIGPSTAHYYKALYDKNTHKEYTQGVGINLY